MTRLHFDTRAINALPIRDVAERYAEVKRSGANYMTQCPWHEDSHPSLLVSKGSRCKCMACGKGGSVIDYVMALRGWDFKEACEDISEAFHIDVEESGVDRPWAPSVKPVKPRKSRLQDVLAREVKAVVSRNTIRMPSLSYIPDAFLTAHQSADSTFCQCLRSIFVEEGVQWAVEQYRLGTYQLGAKDGYVMFPSIDRQGRIHNIKLQRYCTDKGSPLFFHKEEGSTFWLASILQRQGTLPKDASYDSSCFFGEHLLSQRPNNTVVLVESPKNAIVGCLDNPSYLWIAVGNKGNLTRQRLQCLHGRKVIVIPDRDAIPEWTNIINNARDIATFIISSFCEAGMQSLDKKGDVADYLIKKLTV